MYLNCKTYFSFRYGTFSTEELVNAAARLGVRELALTNINNTCDIWDFVDRCQQQEIKPIAGTEIRNDNQLLYLLLAKNNDGFGAINRFLSEHLQQKKPFPQRACLPDVYTIYPFGSIPLNELQADELIGVQQAEVNKLFGLSVQFHAHKLVIRQPVTFQNKTYYNAHRLLRAIDRNVLLSKQQPGDIAGEQEIFVHPEQLMEAFRDYPAIVANTRRIINNCRIEMEFRRDKTRKVFSGSPDEDRELLKRLALDGLAQRYGTNHPQAEERIRKELQIIDSKSFNAYFLITWDIVRYARQRGFFFVGRGSGANSIVAYCLRITDVDPIELDLYFERFLNPGRPSPPDFDLDFSWKDRDEIIEYIFKKYGHDHVCLLGSHATFQTKAILRELGKVFGLPKDEIDKLDSGHLADDKIQQQIKFYGNLIRNFPNHLSIHAGGILISDEPLCQYTARELPPKNFDTSQIDMFIADKIGLFKLDVLSQRGLGHIRDTLDLVRANQGVEINIHDIEHFKQDPQLADKIRCADTVGCFYIESPGMRQLLKKLKCDDFLSLVAASSIIRPGVAQSGMMRQYIHRFHHPNQFEYLHPIMKKLLKDTFGIMIYQEDVIRVAHYFAGLDLSEADVLRRAMSGKYRTRREFDEIREKFFLNCRERVYTEAVTKEVWRQIESFAGFSFSKAHSASFAVESYQSLFLKTYFPIEFMVAVINNFGGFYSRELYFHELKKTGAAIHPPCVNKSSRLTSVSGREVFMGFVHVQSLEERLVTDLIASREKNGAFADLNDFIERLSPEINQVNILIRIGAFRFTGKTKKELLWEANLLHKKNKTICGTGFLFHEKPVKFQLPALASHPHDDALDEMELLGFTCSPVFDLAEINPTDFICAAALRQYQGKEIRVLGYLVTSKMVNTLQGRPMYFHTFLDSAGDWLDTVFFPDTAARYPVAPNALYAMTGTVVEEFGVYSVEVRYAERIPFAVGATDVPKWEKKKAARAPVIN
ncbi:MAG TPA: DNA polymerase III subunit alpha [Puia sp.]|nr:DNA polymerase III subunit alpha [Puia sp.]